MHLCKNIQLLKKCKTQQPKKCTSQEPTYTKKKKNPEQSVPNWKAKTRRDLTQKVLDSMNWQIHSNLVRKAHPIAGHVTQEKHPRMNMTGSHLPVWRKWRGEGKRGKGTRDFNSFNTPCITIFCFPFTSLITIIKATLAKWKLERKKQF